MSAETDRNARRAQESIRSATCSLTGLHLTERSLQEGEAIATKWADLAKRALVANIFYEPEYALPGGLPFGDGVRLLAIHADATPDAPVIGAWPFRIARFR
jgi:hypothetical protein